MFTRLFARLGWRWTAVAAAVLITACGLPASQSVNGGGAASLNGATIRLISSGAAGSTHDLDARAVAPLLAKYLHATVDVVDMPGGGQLEAWNYVSAAPGNGLTIGTIDVEGVMANVWEKVPGQNLDPLKLTMLGGLAGGIGGGTQVLITNTARPPFDSIYDLVSDRSVKVTELGSVGDVPGPLLFKLYQVPSTDLSSYPDSSAELQGLIRGDGQLSVKSWGGGFASFVQSGKGHALLAFTMRAQWKVDSSVPTLPDLFRQDPLPAAQEAALRADAAGLDGGTAFFGPPGIPSGKMDLLRKAVAWAIQQPSFVTQARAARISEYYGSPQDEMSALRTGLSRGTVAEMRRYVPLSNGVPS